MPRIDLVDLELLVAVAEAGSLTHGAERVHVTLASASERIRLLEHRLSLRLFERHARGVVPTAAGRALLAHARAVLERVEALREALPSLRDGAGTRLRLWSNTAALAEWVPARLAAFLRAQPRLQVDVDERASSDIAAALRRGRCDVGVLSDAADADGLHCVAVRDDPLDVVLPRAHPLATRRQLSPAALGDQAWVGLPRDTPLQRWIEGHAHADGVVLAYRLRVSTLDEVCRMVGEGVGAAIVPRATALRRRRDGLARIALRAPWARRGLQVCVRDREALDMPGRALFDALSP